MSVVLITGSCGLIGSEAALYFAGKGFDIVGIDNNFRKYFFGNQGSVLWNKRRIKSKINKSYVHKDVDIRDLESLKKIFIQYSNEIYLVVHCAAQPSHDWASKEPLTDFSINANGTLNLLEMTRLYSPDARFIFTSTNKVYGDRPNRLPLAERPTRWEIEQDHPYYENGIDESMSIDTSTHSVFGASKIAADILVQEYGRYFGMKTVCFRGGCLTGPASTGTRLHGFLSFLIKSAVADSCYEIFGYQGKQVRDNIHSYDLINAFWHYCQKPKAGEVYNIGGGRSCNCSIIEALEICGRLIGRPVRSRYFETPRVGDHIWWISNANKFCKHYPEWRLKYNLESIMSEMVDARNENGY